MIAPATATPAPRPPTVEADRPGSTTLIPTPRVPPAPAPGLRELQLLLDGLAGLARPVPAARSGRSRTRRASGAGWASAPAPARAPAKSTSTSSSKGSLSFLKDPNLSIEEKLMRLLGYLNEKWEKQMQEKLDRIAAAEGGTTAKSSASRSKRSGGFLGSFASAAKGILGTAGLGLLGNKALQGVLGKVGGPVLAAAASALGFPALAPALLRYGPSVLGAISGAVSSAGGAAGGSGGGTEGAGTAAATGGGMKGSEREQIMLDIQRIQSKQKEMFNLVSGILRSNHELRSSIISNIR